nr:MAG TPA: transcriptional regulator EpsA [Caudoviricetes sp.]
MKRKENKDLMMQMLRDGLPYKEIAEATGYKVTSLHRYAQDIEERKEHQNTGVKSYKDLIIRWFEQGKTAEEIGELIGYSPVTVKNKYNEWKREEKFRDEPDEIEEVAFPEKQLSFAERKTFRPPIVEYAGKKWQDVTEIYCPG